MQQVSPRSPHSGGKEGIGRELVQLSGSVVSPTRGLLDGIGGYTYCRGHFLSFHGLLLLHGGGQHLDMLDQDIEPLGVYC